MKTEKIYICYGLRNSNRNYAMGAHLRGGRMVDYPYTNKRDHETYLSLDIFDTSSIMKYPRHPFSKN